MCGLEGWPKAELLCCRFYGYEVATEGDAFVLAFHEPLDAVGWCLYTQKELLAASWPEALLTHPAASIKLRPDLEGVGSASASSSCFAYWTVQKKVLLDLRLAIFSSQYAS